MKIVYFLATEIGTFWIRPDASRVDRCRLEIGDRNLGNYSSPMLAARDVYTHATGWPDWDEKEMAAPDSLNLWEREIAA